MTLFTPKIASKAINADKLSDEVRKGSYFYQTFGHQPACYLASDGASAPANNAANYALFGRGGLVMEYNAIGSGQTIVAPVHDTANGLQLSGDTTTAKGWEYIFGGALGVTNPLAITVPDYAFITLKFKVTTVAVESPIYIGWRKNAAFQAAFGSYTDFALLNVKAGALKSETNLAGAGAVETDLSKAWADGETHTLTVRVLGSLVKYEFDGLPLSAPIYNFAAATVLVPCFGYVNNGTGAAIYGIFAEGGKNKAITPTGNNVL